MKKYLLIIPVIIILISAFILMFQDESTIPVDKDFLKGDWVDEQGYVVNFVSDVAYIYTDTGKYNVTYEKGTATLQDTSDVIRITGRDKDTIIIDGTNIKKCYAYRASGEKGKELCKEIRKKAEGCWSSNILNNCYMIINNKKITSVVNGNVTSVNNDTDGIRLVSLEEIQENEQVADYSATIRFDGEDMILQTFIQTLRYKRTDIEEIQSSVDLKGMIAGEWTMAEHPFDNWTLTRGGTLTINGTLYSYTAKPYYECNKLTVNSTDEYEFEMVDINKLILTKDGITKELYRKDSDEIGMMKELYNLIQERTDLLEKYPDNAGWLASGNSFGDVPYIADTDYIDRSVKEGVFKVSSPEELASVTYYINAYLTDEQSEKADIKIEITKDIDLSGYEWCGIGWERENSETHYFNGQINGNNHSIIKPYVRDSKCDGFIISGKKITVRDITIKDSFIDYYNRLDRICSIGDEASLFDNCHIYLTGETSNHSSNRKISFLGTVTNCSYHWTPSENEDFPYHLVWDENGEIDQILNDLVQITIDDNHNVTRPADLERFRNLGWIIMHNGEQVLHRNAENELHYNHCSFQSGKYEIYLTAFIDGSYSRISNVVSYEIESSIETDDGSLWD